jgi:hypothetical protein
MRLLRVLEPVEDCGHQEQNQRLSLICRRCCYAQQEDGRRAEESMSLLKIQHKEHYLAYYTSNVSLPWYLPYPP